MKILWDSHSLPVGGVDRARAVSENFFPGSYYREAGGGCFTTFLKQNFENLICDGKLFELNRDMRSLERDFRREIY